MKIWLVLGLLTVASAACNRSSPEGAEGTPQGASAFDPCEGVRDLDPHCGWKPHWDDPGVSVNAIDGTRTEIISMDSSDADGLDAGRLHYATLSVCFANGKICGGKSAGVFVNVDGMVDPMSAEDDYSTEVRLKFDDDKPMSQTWGIIDNHEGVFPFGKEKQFLAQLLRHNKLILEFSYCERAPRTLSFELSGLADKMNSIGASGN
jgi:hypothetical protein